MKSKERNTVMQKSIKGFYRTLVAIALITILSAPPSFAACEIEFPQTSANTLESDVTRSPKADIEFKGNNNILFAGKNTTNAFFDASVPQPERFFNRTVLTRKFKLTSSKNKSVDITIKATSAQGAQDPEFGEPLFSRSVNISKLDPLNETIIDCNPNKFFNGFSAGSGSTTINGNSDFDGELDIPLQVSINTTSSDVTINLKNLKLKAGMSYQFEFTSQGIKNQEAAFPETYRVLLGTKEKVNIDAIETVVDDPVGVYLGDPTSVSTDSAIAKNSSFMVGATSPTGAINRTFENVDVPADDYNFKVKQQKSGKRFLMKLKEPGKAPVVVRKRFSSLRFANSTGRFRSSAKDKVTVNADGSQVKAPMSVKASRKGKKFIDKQDPGSKAIIRVDIQNKDETDFIADGFTTIQLFNSDQNFLEPDSLFLDVDPDEDLPSAVLLVDGFIFNVNNPPLDDDYGFSLDFPFLPDARIFRKGRDVTNEFTIPTDFIDLALSKDNVTVVNGDVPSGSEGAISVTLDESAREFIRSLGKDDELVIFFDVFSLSSEFSDGFGDITIVNKDAN